MDRNFFDMVFDAGFPGEVGYRFHAEMQGTGIGYRGQLVKLGVFMEAAHGIASFKKLEEHHIYEFLEFLRQKGFKESTLKTYITAVRQAHRWGGHLFSDDFAPPAAAGYEKWKTTEGG